MSYVKAWKTKSNLINYKAIADNGESLFPSGNQQFSRLAGFHKSLRAIHKFFNGKPTQLEIRWTASARAKTVLKYDKIDLT